MAPRLPLIFRYANGSRRFQKQAGNGDSTTYWHGGHDTPLIEEDATGQATTYIYGPTGCIAVTDAGGDRFILTDHLGSTRVVVSEGLVTAAFKYGPHGLLVPGISSPPSASVRYLFTGHEYDGELGLYHFPARLYDPALGRFYAPDPARQFASPYVFAANDPVNVVDPTGALGRWGYAFMIGAVSGVVRGIGGAAVGATIGAAIAGARGWRTR